MCKKILTLKLKSAQPFNLFKLKKSIQHAFPNVKVIKLFTVSTKKTLFTLNKGINGYKKAREQFYLIPIRTTFIMFKVPNIDTRKLQHFLILKKITLFFIKYKFVRVKFIWKLRNE